MKEITALALVTSPESYGMTWKQSDKPLQDKNDATILARYPYLAVSDVEAFTQGFGSERALHILNASQSPKVTQQNRLRPKAVKELRYRTDVAAQKLDCASAILAIRSEATTTVTVTVEKTVYSYGGATWGTVEEAAQACMADMIDSGQSPDMARTLARAMFPAAFTTQPTQDTTP